MASNCRAHPSSSVGSGSSRVPRITTRPDSTVRSMNARSTPARSTQIRMDFSQRYALIAGSQACGANLENCKRDSSEVRSCNVTCSQRNLRFLIGSIGMRNFHPARSVFNPSIERYANQQYGMAVVPRHSDAATTPQGLIASVYVTGIFFRRDCAPGRLGRVNRSTPFLNSAFAFDSSTSAGNAEPSWLWVQRASCLSGLMQLSRPPQCAARFRACMFAIFEHLHAIYENVFHAYRILMRFVIRGAVGDRRRIEYDHISKHPLLEEPAMIEPQICCRQSTQSPHCFPHWNHFFVPRIFAQYAGEISIGTRMRIGFQEQTLRRLRSFIGAE